MSTVLITGAASGIGRAASQLFARAGWLCVLVDRDKKSLDRLVDRLPGTGHVIRHVDLTDPVQITGLGRGLPQLDALVNNAGLSDDTGLALAEQSSAQVDRLLALNLDAPAAVFTACSLLLQPGARIVNVASGAGLRATPWRGAYSASKAGLIAQTRALAGLRPDL
ncbi:MAG: fabG 3, partial [Rhodoferax sp.]|nr:fabG 3 [Rhodoferax sp.]